MSARTLKWCSFSINTTKQLTVEIIPPVKGDLAIGFVDWNPWPPDDNMGLWRPINITFNYDDRNIYAVNEKLHDLEDLTADIQVFDINSNLLFSDDTKVSLPANESAWIYDMPRIDDLTKTYFLSLKLKNDQNNLVADHFYWLSTREAELDY